MPDAPTIAMAAILALAVVAWALDGWRVYRRRRLAEEFRRRFMGER